MDGTLATSGDLAIRLLRNEPADIGALVRWRAQPHVHQWWDPDEDAPDYDEVAAKYGSLTHPSSKTTPCIIELDGRPIGYLQFYKWCSWADAALECGIDFDDDTYGLDVLLGEPELIGRGVGSRAVALAAAYLETERAASWVSLTTEETNVRAQRAYEKAGFVKVRTVLDTDTREGERVRAWLMERRRPAEG